MKKKLCLNKKPSFRPAEYVAGKSRSYINVYFTSQKGVYQQKKPTFSLGRILNKLDRKNRGEAIAKKINWWLEKRFFYEDFEEWKADKMMIEQEVKDIDIGKEKESKNLTTKIIDALNFGFDAKMEKSKRSKKGDSSHNTYKSLRNNLIKYIQLKKLDNLVANSFKLSDAMQFMLHSKKVRNWGNNTFNINKNLYQSLFQEIVILGFAKENAFIDIPKLESEDVRRKTFSDEDASTFLKYAYEKDRILFYFILLDYICFARPIEIIKMRFCDIDLDNERIIIKGENAKKIKTRYAGIPTEFLPFFSEPFFKKYPSNFYMFGAYFKPNPRKHANKSGVWYRHEKVKNYLFKKGLISIKKGYQTYSWKNIGITHFIDELGVVAASEQAGHKDIKTTLKYKRKEKVNTKVKNFKNQLMPYPVDVGHVSDM